MNRILAVLFAATALISLAIPAQARVRNQPAPSADVEVNDSPFSNFFSNLGTPSGSSPVTRAVVGFDTN
ncbi:MAG: hypothetical protein JWQ94_4574 [Tardiphaga sp.]|nr:hypothetical protein [Tardiphaga sp.]